MRSFICHVDVPDGVRVLAASDLHAHGAWLESLLEQAHFGGTDRLFLVGDYLERGTQSLQTLRTVMGLCKLPNVYATVGNVDLFSLSRLSCSPQEILAYIERFTAAHGDCFFTELCRDAGLPCETLSQIGEAARLLPSIYHREIAFLRGLPAIIDTPHRIFVHGGIPTDDLQALDPDNAAAYLKNDAFIGQGLYFDRWVITGHWPASLNRQDRADMKPYEAREQRIIDLDGGAGVKSDGQVNLLIFPEAEKEHFTVLHRDGFPIYRALDYQEESRTSGHIHYADPWLTVLAREGEKVRVRRCSDGYEMWVPAKNVHTEDGRSRIWGDMTDYRPEIRPGQLFSLIRRNALGAYIKSDGVCGWYEGRMEPV